MNRPEISSQAVDEEYQKLKREAESGGYHLNPDVEFTKELVKGLLVNQSRYGYMNCPCRLASGDREKDIDIICPCYYRDPDISDYGCCYCALYVSQDVIEGKKKAGSIPERRPSPKERQSSKPAKTEVPPSSLKYPVWRCAVCGYLCARDKPPDLCPICRASKDRFERFM